MTATGGNNGGISAATVNEPMGVTLAGSKVVVSDTFNHRVLIWNTWPVSDGVAADLILGQATDTGLSANAGGTPGAATFNTPLEPHWDGARLYVPDHENNRILVWNEMPLSMQQPADFALGQPTTSSTTANNVGVSATTFNQPIHIRTSGNKLAVTDFGNNRVLLWNAIPTGNNTPADLVLGQPDMQSNASNNGGVSASSLSLPTATHVDGTHVFVADYLNNRVLIWNSVPAANGAPADVALGQSSMGTNTTNSGGLSASSLSLPLDVLTVGSKLLVADSGNNRVLVWNQIPTTDNQPADFVLGQPDLDANAANNGGVSASSLAGPSGLHYDGQRLYVVDYGNNRVLVWNEMPSGSDPHPADLVLGQADMTSNTANAEGIDAASLNGPVRVTTASGRLYAVDQLNHRILIWNHLPSTNGAPADKVFGQPDFISGLANSGGDIGLTTLSSPWDVEIIGDHMFVAGRANHRVLLAPIP